MSESDIGEAIRRRYHPAAGFKPDYREKLKHRRQHSVSASEDASLSSSPSPAERVRSIAQTKPTDGTAIQSVLVAVLQVLRRVHRCECQVAAASISKGQGEKLQRMIKCLEETDQALCDTLSEQGAKMLDLTVDKHDEEEDESNENSWWFALTEALQTIEDDIEWITSLVSRQPKGSTGRTVSGVVVRLLHRHYNAMLLEAERWMS